MTSMKKESGACLTMKSAGALWRGHSRQSMFTRIGMVYRGGDSDVCGMQKFWRKEVSCGRKQRTGGDLK